MRRTLIVVAAVIVLLGVGVVGYFYFFGDRAEVEVAPSSTTNLPVSGDDTESGITEGEDSSSEQGGGPTTVTQRLVKVSAGPVVPSAVVTSSAGTASSSPQATVTYIERQSGNVFSYSVAAGTITRTSNRTLPGILSATWLPDASRALVRYLSGADVSTVNTYVLSSDGSDGFFLPQNLSDVAVSSTSILTLSSGVNGSSASVARTDGTQAIEVFSTPLSSLRVAFAGKDRYVVYTRPSTTLPGAAYLVDKTGHFSRIAGPRTGLVALASPLGKWVLVSFSRGDSLAMELVNTATGEVLPLPIATITDKCVWTADDSALYCGVPVDPPTGFAYPDDWYQGVVTFSDRIWRIQVSGRYAQFVLDFSQETAGPLDATALAIDPLASTLVFINKKDGSLWSYSL